LAALRSSRAIWAAAALLFGSVAVSGAAPETVRGARVEARSTDLLAVGTVHGDRMTIHLSRIIDNAPVHDAVVTVVLRGATHTTTAEIDGSYSFQTPDLRLPGAASMQFQVALGAAREELTGTLQIADAAEQPEDKNSSRQLGWWVLNFAVCIAFLLLWSRRKANRSS
jgi:hypothetical protein